METDKNLLVAVGLSILVYLVWFTLVERRISPALAPGPAPQTQAAPTSAAAPAAGSAENAGASEPPAAASSSRPPAESQPATIGKAAVKINPWGAAIASWEYQEPLGKVELIDEPSPGLFSTFPETKLRRVDRPGVLAYEGSPSRGLRVLKEFVPGDEGRLPRLRITATNVGSAAIEAGGWSVNIGPGLGTVESEKIENAKQSRALGLQPAGEGLRGTLEVLKPGRHPGPYRWVGVDNRYFLAALLPQDKDFAEAVSALPPRVSLVATAASLAHGQSRTWELPYYVGEKGHTWLSRYHAGLERSINFGFFADIGSFLLKILDWLHGLIGNWGWSIILLTVMLQVIFLPLTYKSFKAQAAMKKLQPEIARLQQRYPNDPTKLSAETMELYRKHGANPMTGCWPMLIQMPILFALYTMLRNAWELHGAPWIGWIHDLSAKDPYYVLPVLLGGLMFGQSKLNPPAGDPSQQQMMTWMPVIFTFMFLKLPSGLTLYYLVNSLISTSLQLSMRNRFDQPRSTR